MAVKKGGLGKGLDILFDENASEKSAVEIKLTEIEPNRAQPRMDFDEEALSELAESIASHGVLQPIVVRPLANGNYGIIAGERRWRAARMAGLEKVPVMIRDTDEKTASEIALIENLQRENLNAYEEALGLDTLIKKYGMTQEEAASSVGKSRSALTNSLRLLSLPEEMLTALREGKISAGQARTILSAHDDEARLKLFSAALSGESVRRLEEFAKTLAAKKEKTEVKKPKKTRFQTEVALSLKNELHRPVTITSLGNGKGKLTVEFYSDEELKDFAKRLSGE